MKIASHQFHKISSSPNLRDAFPFLKPAACMGPFVFHRQGIRKTPMGPTVPSHQSGLRNTKTETNTPQIRCLKIRNSENKFPPTKVSYPKKSCEKMVWKISNLIFIQLRSEQLKKTKLWSSVKKWIIEAQCHVSIQLSWHFFQKKIIRTNFRPKTGRFC